jgi:hypothetical protein
MRLRELNIRAPPKASPDPWRNDRTREDFNHQWSTEGSVAIEGPVAHYLGGLATVLGRYRDADVYFTQAAASCERAEAKFFAARTDLSWGRMLAERAAPGDTEKARELLTNARTAAAAYGYANVERRAAQALRDLT